MIRVTALHIYPVKSLGGIAVESSEVDACGLRFDRRWMVVDAARRFHTQRWRPRMALVRTRLEPGGVTLSAPGRGAVTVPPGGGKPLTVAVWRDVCVAESCGADADDWVSDLLGEACRVVWIPDSASRHITRRREESLGRIGFADAYPLLAISEASLAGLNRRLPSAVPMSRFRPNVVVAGVTEHAEDEWDRVRIGSLDFVVAKQCERCVLTTIDQETGVAGTEPLRTLATYRRRGANVVFGVYLAHQGTGAIHLGDEVSVSAAR